MSCINENDPLKLETTITENGGVITSPLTEASYDYWEPGNNTGVKSGNWVATIIDANTGEIEYDIPSDILTDGIWKIQSKGTIAGLSYKACMDTITVKAIGS